MTIFTRKTMKRLFFINIIFWTSQYFS